MSETAFATFCGIKVPNRLPFHRLMSSHHHLCDTLSILDDEIHIRKVDQYNADLPPIVCIDGARGVEHGDSFFQRQPAPWTNLSFKALRECDKQPRWNETTFQRTECNGLVKVCS